MDRRFQQRTPRVAMAPLALVMTVALASFIDYLANDHAVSLRQTAQQPAAIVTAQREQGR